MYFGTLAALLLALVPCAVAWWTGRGVLRRGDDPALPDLLLLRQQRLRTAVAVALAFLVVLGGARARWAIPLALVALPAGNYPLRRAMLDERWGLGAYLWHAARRFVGAAGPWLAIGVAPLLVLAPPTLGGSAVVAVVLAVLLVAWGWSAAPLWRRAFGTTPLATRPDLAPGLEAVVARSTGPRPAVLRFGARGERTAAAYALPALGTPGSVVFSDALLELLEPAEVVAVFAHEVAHLEHFTRRRLARLRAVTTLLALGAAALPLALRAWAPAASAAAPWAWPLVVVVAVLVAVSGGRGQAAETASDLRAAELCGDAEALVRALTKLHAAMRLPRRWPASAERTATHPSLARRIQALRAGRVATGGAAGPAAAPGAGAPPQQQSAAAAGDGGNQAVLGATDSPPATVLRTATPGSWVVLDDRRLHLFDGVEGIPSGASPDAPTDLAWLAAQAAGARSVAYERLSDLRVEGEGTRAGTRLAVTERSGRRWSVPLDPAAARAARAAIDAVDVRLGPPPPDRRTERALGTVLAASTGLLLILGGQAGVALVVSLLAAVRPTAAALAALGAMTLAGAALSLGGTGAGAAGGAAWGRVLGVEGAAPVAAVLVPLLGAAALWLAVRQLRQARRRAAEGAAGGGAADDDAGAGRGTVAPLVALGILAALYGAAAAWAAARGMASAAARGMASAATPLARTLAVLLAGLAAALAAQSWESAAWGGAGGRRARAGAAAAGAVAALAGRARARPAAARGGGGGLGAAPALAWERRHAAPGPGVSLGGVGRGLDLSPSGARFAVLRYPAPPDDAAEDEGEYDEYGDESGGRARPARLVVGTLGGGDGTGAGGARRELDALSAAFLDDDQLLVLARRGDSLELRVEPAGGMPAGAMPAARAAALPSAPGAWRLALPAVAGARLRADGATGAWTVVGWDRRRGGAVTLTGRVGDAGVRARRWSPALGTDGAGGFSFVAPAADGSAVGLRLRAPGRASALLALVGIASWESELWHLEGEGRGRRIATVPGFVRCAEAGPVVCATLNGGRSTLLAVAADGAVRTLGAFPEMVSAVAPGPGGQVAVAEPVTGDVVLVDPARGRATRLALPPELRHAAELRWTAGGLALLTYQRGGMRATVVRVEGEGLAH